MGLLTQDDTTQFRNWFEEMAKLVGWKVGYQYPLGNKKTIHSEPNMPMSNPIQLDIIFNENPTLDTLKKHGWVVEIGEQRPVIAQVPYNTPNLQRYSRIIIPPVGTIVDARIFEVTAISSILEYPDCWTVRLAPVYKTIQENNDYSQSNTKTMDVLSKGTMDQELPRSEKRDHAVYDVPNIPIDTSEGYISAGREIIDNTKETETTNNVLGKNYNDFD